MIWMTKCLNFTLSFKKLRLIYNYSDIDIIGKHYNEYIGYPIFVTKEKHHDRKKRLV